MAIWGQIASMAGSYVKTNAIDIVNALSAGKALKAQIGAARRQTQSVWDTMAYNKSVYELQSQVIDIKKDISAKRYKRSIKNLKGRMVTAVAASGYDLSGSSLEVVADGLEQAELDKQIDLFNFDMEKVRAKGASIGAGGQVQNIQFNSNVASQGIGSLLTQGNNLYQRFRGSRAVAGQGSYGAGTPKGARNMGTWTKVNFSKGKG